MKKILLGFIVYFIMSGVSYSADYYFVGVDAFNKGAYDKAYSNISHAVKLNPKNVNARYYLAQILIKQNRVSEAIEQYNRIIFLAPDSSAARLSQKGLSLIASANDKAKSSPINNELDKYKDNYLDYVLADSGDVSRWRSFPLNVYIEQKKQANVARNAFSQWQSRSKGLVRFNYVGSPANAQISVKFKNKLESTSTDEKFFAGFSRPMYDKSGFLIKSEINILTINPETQKNFDDNFICGTTLHELGHSLGFAGHSPNENDVMAASTYNPKTQLTQRDVNTLFLLYKIDKTTLASKKAVSGDLKLKQAQEYVKNSPEKYIGWSNLGAIYFGKKMYAQSIMYFQKAIAIEPERAELYNSLGAAYRMSGDKQNAYLNFKKANNLEPTNELYKSQFEKVSRELGK